MHPEAFAFLVEAAQKVNPKGLKVLEIGSLNVNGSARSLFEQADTYHGIDRQGGPGVDQVVDAREYNGAEKFDVVITTETLEHDLEPEKILESACKALRPGGLLIVTAAGPGRAAHNTDGNPWDGLEPYRNIDPQELSDWLSGWEQVEIRHNEQAHDVYATARKPERQVDQAQREPKRPKKTKRKNA